MGSPRLDALKLYNRAVALGELSVVEDNLFNFSSLYQTNYEFRHLVRQSGLSLEDRVKGVLSLSCFKKSSVFETLLPILIESRDLERTQAFNDNFTKVVDEKLGRVTVLLTSAVALPDESVKSIQKDLERILNNKVHLRHVIEENLVAGIVIRLPNGKIYDFSLKKELAEFKSFVLEKE